MKDVCPCLGCKDRTAEPNCHSTCYERFIPWSERQEERKKRERDSKIREGQFIAIRNESARRSEKYRHKRR